MTAARLLPLVLITAAFAAEPIAPTPPMGWNSWDAYGTTVTEAEVKANADYMAAQLRSHGWQYIVVDIQWSEQNPRAHGYRPNADLAMDAYGRLIPAPNRFPSSADGQGFRPLAAYIHSKGLKFGIHIMRGIPRKAVTADLPVFGSSVHAADIADPNSTCRWNTDMYGVDMSKPGAQDYYDSILRLYADWGIDFIKADDIARPFHGPEIAALHRSIEKTGRPIVLSLSPGPADLSQAAFYAENANMWRMWDDFWDRWTDLKAASARMAPWSELVRPSAWPDADMLPLGRIGIRAERGDDRQTRFTHDEQRTLMTLWSIFRSPLMLGGDLPSNDAWTLSVITNDEVLAANQKGAHPRRISEGAWTSEAPGAHSRYLALINLTDEGPMKFQAVWKDLGLSGRCVVRDLWEKTDLRPLADGITIAIPPHGAVMLRVTEAGQKKNGSK
jgi:alpha-galactosidase